MSTRIPEPIRVSFMLHTYWLPEDKHGTMYALEYTDQVVSLTPTVEPAGTTVGELVESMTRRGFFVNFREWKKNFGKNDFGPYLQISTYPDSFSSSQRSRSTTTFSGGIVVPTMYITRRFDDQRGDELVFSNGFAPSPLTGTQEKSGPLFDMCCLPLSFLTDEHLSRADYARISNASSTYHALMNATIGTPHEGVSLLTISSTPSVGDVKSTTIRIEDMGGYSSFTLYGALSLGMRLHYELVPTPSGGGPMKHPVAVLLANSADQKGGIKLVVSSIPEHSDLREITMSNPVDRRSLLSPANNATWRFMKRGPTASFSMASKVLVPNDVIREMLSVMHIPIVGSKLFKIRLPDADEEQRRTQTISETMGETSVGALGLPATATATCWLTGLTLIPPPALELQQLIPAALSSTFGPTGISTPGTSTSSTTLGGSRLGNFQTVCEYTLTLAEELARSKDLDPERRQRTEGCLRFHVKRMRDEMCHRFGPGMPYLQKAEDEDRTVAYRDGMAYINKVLQLTGLQF